MKSVWKKERQLGIITSIKNPCSCAQANNVGKIANNVNTNIDDDCMVCLPFSSVTSSQQPFQPSKKGTEPGQIRVTQNRPSPHPARAHVNVKFDNLVPTRLKIRRWTDPGRCSTRARVKRPYKSSKGRQFWISLPNEKDDVQGQCCFQNTGPKVQSTRVCRKHLLFESFCERCANKPECVGWFLRRWA